MNRIANIIFSPVKAIREIAAAEPLFSGLFIFTVSVIAGNIEWTENIFINLHTGVFQAFLMVAAWASALFIMDMIIMFIVSLFNPGGSTVLNAERVRKLFIVQLNFSVILMIKPVLDIFFSSMLSWIVIFIWLGVIVLSTIVYLWEIPEIKATLAAVLAVIILFSGIKLLELPDGYVFTDDFNSLTRSIESKTVSLNGGMLGLLKNRPEARDVDTVIKEADKFMRDHPDSPAAPYCSLIKARAYYAVGEFGLSKQEYIQILESGSQLPGDVYNTAMLTLRSLANSEEYLFLPADNSIRRYRTIFRICNIPDKFVSFSDSIVRVSAMFNFIRVSDTDTIENRMDFIRGTFAGTAFEDDLLYMIAEKYEQKGDLSKAANLYEYVAGINSYFSRSRIRIESGMDEISSYLPAEVLSEKFCAPYALYRLAGVYQKAKENQKALAVWKRLAAEYPEHTLSAKGLIDTAEFYEGLGMFEKAIKIYSRILKTFPAGSLKKQAEHKRRIIKQNLNNRELLAAYSKGWSRWQAGEIDKAVEIYNKLIDSFPDSDLAQELQFNLGEYYKNTGQYLKAIEAFRKGFEKFHAAPRNFDFGYQVGIILFKDLRYYRQSVQWFEDLIEKFGVDYKSPGSGITTLEVAWKTAEITRDYLKDYDMANRIYDSIIKNYGNREIVARALFEKASIEEKIYRRYRTAVAMYSEIVNNYSDTAWERKARERVEAVYGRGVKMLEKRY